MGHHNPKRSCRKNKIHSWVHKWEAPFLQNIRHINRLYQRRFLNQGANLQPMGRFSHQVPSYSPRPIKIGLSKRRRVLGLDRQRARIRPVCQARGRDCSHVCPSDLASSDKEYHLGILLYILCGDSNSEWGSINGLHGVVNGNLWVNQRCYYNRAFCWLLCAFGNGLLAPTPSFKKIKNALDLQKYGC